MAGKVPICSAVRTARPGRHLGTAANSGAGAPLSLAACLITTGCTQAVRADRTPPRTGAPMRRLDVLISGAGIAGCTLAYWLARYGHSPTVVERGGALRSSGSPVDVRGPAADVAERMNIMPRLREARTHVAGLTFL